LLARLGDADLFFLCVRALGTLPDLSDEEGELVRIVCSEIRADEEAFRRVYRAVALLELLELQRPLREALRDEGRRLGFAPVEPH
jgi:hypothetical protein